MYLKKTLLLFALAFSCVLGHAETEIIWWHSMSGARSKAWRTSAGRGYSVR